MSAINTERTSAQRGFQQLLRIGSYFNLIPYTWDKEIQLLQPGSKTGLFMFSLHKYVKYVYTFNTWFRFLQAHLKGQFSLLSCLWAITGVTTLAGVWTLDWYQSEVMYFVNRLLSNTLFDRDTLKKVVIKETSPVEREAIREIESSDRRHLGRYMFFNLLLFYTNPELHIFIVQQNPCAPNFFSSWFLNCKSNFDNSASYWEKLPFVIFEFYMTCKWQYFSCFQWSLIYMGLAVVMTEVNKLENVTVESFSRNEKWEKIIHKYRKGQLILTIINKVFRVYLIVFPIVGTYVVAALIYGVIRLWRIDPQSNVMFPLCAIRCAFEAMTPLAMAGAVNSGSDGVLAKWRQVMVGTAGKERDYGMNMNRIQGAARKLGVGRKSGIKMARLLEKSCRPLMCSSFESSIYLSTIDGTVQQTTNLLCSFPEL